ncbi:hypothetical protein AOE01nite_20640 [Acetobacter oeni]|uniref:Uncharacterized protein n=1 Tax=Acetobacter oeni TaxID=304077 RepID=A0A511XLL8_9PROT|nr:Na+/melibiose symporter-like transporter [Acetobacter oeni]GBR04724.1 hypothetical protein AA21952_1510 [Acetobacter oeni LMG 21952]GEN63840.1 hypothetical protein AOE01nite_20640 [Acetobacter oeni]
MFGAIYSFVNTPCGALAVMISHSPADRVELNAFRMTGCQAGRIAPRGPPPPSPGSAAAESMTQHQYGMALYVLALPVIGSILWLCVARGCVVRYPPAPRPAEPAGHAA